MAAVAEDRRRLAVEAADEAGFAGPTMLAFEDLFIPYSAFEKML
jgi:hypothetical protein